MAEPTLSNDLTDVRRRVAQDLSWDRTYINWDPNQKTDFDDILKDGYRRFLNPTFRGRPHEWSFMIPVESLDTVAPYTTGTITVESGVVTGAGTTFPTDSGDRELYVSNVAYTVASYDSATQITLDDTSVNVDALTNYSLIKSQYVLPDDFGGMEGPFTYRSGNDAAFGPIEHISDIQIREKQQFTFYTQRPQQFSMVPINLTVATGQRHSIRFWPAPDAVYRIYYQYRRNPSIPTGVSEYFWGGASMAEPFLACVLAEAELYDAGQQGPRHAECIDAMDRAIQRDRADNMPDFLGRNDDRSDGRQFNDNAVHTWVFGGVTTYEGH